MPPEIIGGALSFEFRFNKEFKCERGRKWPQLANKIDKIG
jgi:hypothetical protein